LPFFLLIGYGSDLYPRELLVLPGLPHGDTSSGDMEPAGGLPAPDSAGLTG